MKNEKESKCSNQNKHKTKTGSRSNKKVRLVNDILNIKGVFYMSVLSEQ